MSEVKSTVGEESTSNKMTVNTLEIKQKARPLLLGVDLNAAVQEYIQSLRMVSGVINTLVVMAASETYRQIKMTSIGIFKAITKYQTR